MRTFDLNFSKRRSFVFSDVCVTLRSFVNRKGRTGPKTFGPFLEIAEDYGGSASCDTQTICRTLFTVATALLSPPFFGLVLGCSSTFQCGNEHSLRFTSRFGLVN